MVNTLDYATPSVANAPASPLTWAMTASVVEHFLVFSLYAAALDGGRLARMCAAVSIGFWLIVLIIALRRRRNPSKVDVAFVAVGYPLMLFSCIFAATGEL
jgi:hypothetical protein